MSYFEFVIQYGPRMLSGVGITVLQLICSAALAIFISLVFGLMRLSKSRAIQRATEHFKAKPLKRIEIEEWGDEDGPMVAYSSPFTLKDQGRLQYLTEKQSAADTLAELLIMKLVDENGDKLFTIEDKNALRNDVDASVVARIANQVMAGDAEALEKN